MRYWSEAERTFDDYMEEHVGTIEIFGVEYDPATVLKRIDPIHYREAILNWLDADGIDSDQLLGDLSV